jgi:hypothetical protein
MFLKMIEGNVPTVARPLDVPEGADRRFGGGATDAMLV